MPATANDRDAATMRPHAHALAKTIQPRAACSIQQLEECRPMASRWEGSGQRSDGGVSTFRRRGVIPVWTVLVAVLFMQLNVPAAAQEAGAVSATVSSDNPTLGSAHASPQSDNGTGSVDPATPKEAKAEKKDKDDDRAAVLRGSVVVAPLPISSPAIGTGVIPVVGYIFHLS